MRRGGDGFKDCAAESGNIAGLATPLTSAPVSWKRYTGAAPPAPDSCSQPLPLRSVLSVSLLLPSCYSNHWYE